MLFVVKRSFLLPSGSFILRSTKFEICSKQCAKGFKSQSNCLVQRKLLKSSRPFAYFYNSKRYFFQSFCRWQSQCDAEVNSDPNAFSVPDDTVVVFQKLLCNKLESAKIEFEKLKKQAIERKGYMSFPIQSFCASGVGFSLTQVCVLIDAISWKHGADTEDEPENKFSTQNLKFYFQCYVVSKFSAIFKYLIPPTTPPANGFEKLSYPRLIFQIASLHHGKFGGAIIFRLEV